MPSYKAKRKLHKSGEKVSPKDKKNKRQQEHLNKMDCLFGVLRRFQHCTGHITTGSWKGRGNQYIEFARVVYCKLPTNGKQLPAFPLTAVTGIDPRPQRWEARVLPLCHRGPLNKMETLTEKYCDSTASGPSNINV